MSIWGGLPTQALTSKESRADTPSPLREGSDDDIDFEFSLDIGASGRGLSSKSNKRKVEEESSEFELNLDDELTPAEDETSAFGEKSSKDDIFETDFEIPALEEDSASEIVSLAENDSELESSDFDLALRRVRRLRDRRRFGLAGRRRRRHRRLFEDEFGPKSKKGKGQGQKAQRRPLVRRNGPRFQPLGLAGP